MTDDLKTLLEIPILDFSCRSCKFFVRVRKENEDDCCDRVGFCIRGCRGDYGLYRSFSGQKCWTYSKYQQETVEKENKILDFERDLYSSTFDHRTKLYKTMADFAKKSGFTPNYRNFLDNDKLCRIYSHAILHEQYNELWNRVHISEKQYNQMLFKIQIMIFEELKDIIPDYTDEIKVEE